MKKTIFLIFYICLHFSLFTQNIQSNTLLQQIDDLISFNHADLSAEYTIVTQEPGGSISKTVAAVFRRDAKQQLMAIILEPSQDKGQGYLKDQGVLWLYDPDDNTFTSTSSKNKFRNTGLRISDLEVPNYAKNYEIVGQSQQQLGKFNCTVLELSATNNSVTYAKTKIWVSEDNLIRKTEDYSLSGQLLRTTAIPTYQKVDSKWLPQTIVIQDHLIFKVINNQTVYERTSITIQNPSASTLPDTVYTKEYLQRVR
ncbi:MAG: outer membrane lipoprotein-sorting protein [Spirochaetales bacterium]